MKKILSNEEKLIKKRILYTIATAILFIVEVSIAVFIHDKFIRPYIGDVLVVAVIYCFVRIFIPDKCMWLPAAVFGFAALVEILQYFNLVELLGVSDNRILSVIIGSVFDIKDIICYAIGCILIFVFEICLSKKKK